MESFSIPQLTETLRSLGWMGYSAGVLLILLQTVLPVVPFVVVAGANVLLFGLWPGFIVNYTFSCLGAMLVFYYARKYGRHRVEARAGRYLTAGQWNARLRRHGVLYIALSRVIPVLPSLAINLGAAVMKIRFRHFALGTLIGKAPMVLLESMIGHDLLHFEQYKGRLLILLLFLGIMLLIGNHLKRKWTGS